MTSGPFTLRRSTLRGADVLRGALAAVVIIAADIPSLTAHIEPQERSALTQPEAMVGTIVPAPIAALVLPITITALLTPDDDPEPPVVLAAVATRTDEDTTTSANLMLDITSRAVAQDIVVQTSNDSSFVQTIVGDLKHMMDVLDSWIRKIL